MFVTKESEILDQNIRRKLIEEMISNRNSERKREAYKRYLCYKDQIDQFVVENLSKQFDTDTVKEMAYCISNISLVRKIIDKLARVYNAGCERSIEDNEDATKAIQGLEKILCFNSQIRSTNKFLKLQRNVAFYIKPCPVQIPGSVDVKYNIKLEPMNPYLYDVAHDSCDKTKPLVYMLSNYCYEPILYSTGDLKSAARPTSASALPHVASNSHVDEDPLSKYNGEIIWWSDSYHFTTNYKGEIVSDQKEQNANPIRELPFVNFSLDQDGEFWAIGGDDLIDGAILVNCLLTHNQHVGITQGYGQFYMRGKNLPRGIKVGPTKGIIMEYEKDDPTPEAGFLSANPQLDSLRGLTENYIALLLTTNNLSTSAVGASLGSNQMAPSGIAMIIDKAESMEDVQDQRQIFIDSEPSIWRKIALWMGVYKDNLIDDLKEYQLDPAATKDLKLSFTAAPVIMSEAEKLANFKLRKDLGIDSDIDLIMADNPGFDREDAEEKYKQVLEDKMNEIMIKNQIVKENPDLADAMNPQDPNAQPNQGANPNESYKGNGNGQPNNSNN